MFPARSLSAQPGPLRPLPRSLLPACSVWETQCRALPGPCRGVPSSLCIRQSHSINSISNVLPFVRSRAQHPGCLLMQCARARRPFSSRFRGLSGVPSQASVGFWGRGRPPPPPSWIGRRAPDSAPTQKRLSPADPPHLGDGPGAWHSVADCPSHSQLWVIKSPSFPKMNLGIASQVHPRARCLPLINHLTALR